MPLLSRVLLALPLISLAAGAAPLSQQTRIDFFRDVPSRNLQGLATRSDGRITAGPVLQELRGEIGADLLWSIVRGPGDSWLIGTGPQGSIRQVTTDVEGQTVTTTEWARIDDAQVYALQRLPDGTVLAGSSPRGGLHVLREGAVVASLNLPVDSVFDLLLSPDGRHVFVGTGNPGRVYRVDLAKFAGSGITSDVVRDSAALSARGIERFGDIRDRNVRRLARAADGRVLAGSSPAGKLYAFPAAGGSPELLLDHTRAEITDIRVEPNGDVFALVVHSSAPGQQMRVIRTAPTPAGAAPDAAAATPVPEEELSDVPNVERFSGRSALVWLPGGNGFPETLASRANIALYRMAARGDTLVMSGGDAGEIVGFDRIQRRSLTFGGSTSAQLSDLVPLGPDQFLVLRNNPAGLAVLDFAANAPRRAETRRIDLRTPGTFGALRFNRLRTIGPKDLQLSLRANRADDEVEGWSPWRTAHETDGGWHAPDLRGRFAQVRIELPAQIDPQLEIDTALLHFLPQNRRPSLQAFRIISPNFGLLPRTDSPTSPLLTLGQVIAQPADAPSSGDKRSAALLSSQLVPQPGAQLVYWTIEDPDGDELAATFSIRRDGTSDWIDLAVDTSAPWVQFDRSHLPDGVYFTRLRVREQAPRPAADRLEVVIQTDDLVIDQTAPAIEQAALERRGGVFVVTVIGRDALSLLAGIELKFNNGHEVTVEQPADGVLDGRVETFVAEVPAADVSGATNVEVLLYDAIGNSTARRLPVP
jgi:hypothetical protein